MTVGLRRRADPGAEVSNGHDTASRHGTPAALPEAFEVRLAPDQLDVLADLVAERLSRSQRSSASVPELVDARGVATAIGVSAAWVRDHAVELGGVRLGDGPRSRWRFDLSRAVAVWAARSCSTSERSLAADAAPQRAPRRRRAPRSGIGVELLPIRGPQEARDAA